MLFAEATTVNDPFFELIQNALFVTPGSGVAVKGRLSQGPSKRADRALQKTVRKVLHIILTNEFVLPTV
jgi:hypothetical protein